MRQNLFARPSASSSKLARALADAGSTEPADPLAAYLLEQQRALIAGDLALRRGSPRSGSAVRLRRRMACDLDLVGSGGTLSPLG